MTDSNSNSTCPIVPSNGYALPLQDYFANANNVQQLPPYHYRTTVAIERIHRLYYRWNQNDNLQDLWDTDASRDDQLSYLYGLFWASFTILLLALLWLLLLVGCKLYCCWGPKYCGFFSARRLRPFPPDEPTEALEKQEAMIMMMMRNNNTATTTKNDNNNNNTTRITNGMPFQYNGIASGYDEMGKPIKPKTTKKRHKTAKKIVKGTIQAPKKIVQTTMKAPQKLYSSQKKKFQQTFNKSKKFARINSAGELEEEEDPAADAEQAPNSPSSSGRPDDDNNTSIGTGIIMTQEDERLVRDYHVALERYYHVCDARNARMRRIRAATAVSALGIVCAAILFVVMGLPTIYDSSSSITSDAIAQMQQRARQLQQAVTTLQTIQQETSAATQKFIELDVNGLCPNAAEEFCTTASAAADQEPHRQCDFATLPQLQPELDTLMRYLDGTFELVLQEETTMALQDDVQTLQYLLIRAEAVYPTTVAWTFWVAVGCNLTLAMICLLIFVAVMLLYFGHPLPVWLKTLRSFVMVPTFLLLVVLGWIFSSVFIASSVGMADACINSPDAVLLQILERYWEGNALSSESNSVILDFLKYYINGCPVASAPQDLDQRIVIMTELIVPALQSVGDAMTGVGFDDLEQICGVDLAIFASKCSAMVVQLCRLSQSVLEARMLLDCPAWIQWYRQAAYGGMCYYSSTGLAWAASTQLVMVALSMVTLTLRVSFFELNEVADEGTKCTSNWCCCVEVMAAGEDDESAYEYHSTDGSEYYEEEILERVGNASGSQMDGEAKNGEKK